jgi:hypothetical protein
MLISCSRSPDNYLVAVTNNYFESLQNVCIGNIAIADSLLTRQTSVQVTIPKGNHIFSTLTASGLQIKTDLSLRGDRQNVTLAVNEYGKVMKF